MGMITFLMLDKNKKSSSKEQPKIIEKKPTTKTKTIKKEEPIIKLEKVVTSTVEKVQEQVEELVLDDIV